MGVPTPIRVLERWWLSFIVAVGLCTALAVFDLVQVAHVPFGKLSAEEAHDLARHAQEYVSILSRVERQPAPNGYFVLAADGVSVAQLKFDIPADANQLLWRTFIVDRFQADSKSRLPTVEFAERPSAVPVAVPVAGWALFLVVVSVRYRRFRRVFEDTGEWASVMRTPFVLGWRWPPIGVAVLALFVLREMPREGSYHMTTAMLFAFVTLWMATIPPILHLSPAGLLLLAPYGRALRLPWKTIEWAGVVPSRLQPSGQFPATLMRLRLKQRGRKETRVEFPQSDDWGRIVAALHARLRDDQLPDARCRLESGETLDFGAVTMSRDLVRARRGLQWMEMPLQQWRSATSEAAPERRTLEVGFSLVRNPLLLEALLKEYAAAQEPSVECGSSGEVTAVIMSAA